MLEPGGVYVYVGAPSNTVTDVMKDLTKSPMAGHAAGSTALVVVDSILSSLACRCCLAALQVQLLAKFCSTV